MKTFRKIISLILVISFLDQIFLPVALFALTTGPNSPEVASFEPVGTTDMVNLFTGDFTYNIPLLDVGGYPINLAYHSGISMDAEASWCGLGWNINPGSINRTMRGIPDDFKGDTVTKEFNMKDNRTWGLDLGTSVKIYGIALGLNGGLFKNNYTGFGTSFGTNVSMGSGFGGKSGMTAGLGLNLSSSDGATASASVNFSEKENRDEHCTDGGSFGISASTNTRTGFKGLTLNTNYSHGGYTGSKDCKITFGYPTFVPTIQMPLENSSFAFNASTGGEIWGIDPNLTFSGFCSQQNIAVKRKDCRAYGYANSQYGFTDYTAILDFNREKDGPYEKGTQILPIPTATFDLFSVNGQGVSGQYRAYRGDVGVFYDPQAEVTTKFNVNSGAQLGAGNLVHGGYTLDWTDVHTETEKWQSRNKILEYVNYIKPNTQAPDFEHTYFKNIGEKTLNDTDYQNSIGNSDLMKVDIAEDDAYANRQFNKYTATNAPIGTIELSSVRKKASREKRQELFSALNGLEASCVGVDKKIISHNVNSNPYDLLHMQKWPRQMHPYHHFSEITVLDKNGKRYVYGIPTYNNIQKEKTFSVDHPSSYPSTGIITYGSGDNSTANLKGEDNYYSAEKIPAYATSYLLTEVLSPDYVDVSGDGVSGDDYGDAYRFNYSLVNPHYHWRVPFNPNTANYNEGFASNPNDDKGSYLYGNKELWYPHSIESKNFIALFILEKRNDGYGSADEIGGRNNADSLLRIKEIKLYSKIDYLRNAHPVPIKTVHFEYDYTLCRNVDNNINHLTSDTADGKLTLKKIWFTYGNNDIGRLNAYEFHYNSYNPSYDIKKYDRWGNFMDNNNIDPGNYPNNVFYPYTYQQKDSTDKWSSSWNLTDIDLPSGGTINVSYESNDYAYVQNKKATQMFRIDRFGPDKNYPGSDQELFDASTLNANFYFFIKVSDTTTMSNNDEIRARYLAGLDNVYFKCLIDVDKGNHYDYVPGYVHITDIGIPTNKHSNDGIIYLKLDYVTDGVMGQVNPISKAAWQFIRINLPALAYPGSQNDGDWKGLIKSLTAMVWSCKELFSRFDRLAQGNGWGSQINCPKSWVRLLNPISKKLGGGCRVKQITLNDNWNTITTGDGTSHLYGQNYDYTTKDDHNNIISSGVAAYEPILGGDEIALRNPLPYETGALLVPKTHRYSETPLGESLYPAPTIGYSKVTVSSIYHTEGTPSKTGTGKTINEFYTAKDFPVINQYTDINAQHFKVPAILELFGISGQEYVTTSQGFTVEVNDMHGKEKAVSTYNESNMLISSISYKYKTDANKHLVNNVDVLKADSSITTALVGKDIDLWLDMRQQQSDIISPGTDFNLETMLYGYFPVIVPPIIPKYSHEITRFRSVADVKYIQRFGILDEVVKVDQGSRVTTKNLLFDSESGEPLLTQTSNEFNDPEFEFTYPSHWAYDGTGQAYKNIRTYILKVTVSGGNITGGTVTPEDYLTNGDEILIFGATSTTLPPTRAWVNKLASGAVKLIDINGNPLSIINHFTGSPISVNLLVVRSGRQNMANVPIGKLVLDKYSPVNYTTGHLELGGSNIKITQATAKEYNDKWKKSCREVTAIECDTSYDWPLSGECLERFWNNIIRYDTTHIKSIMSAGYIDTLTVGTILNMYGASGCSASFNGLHFYSLSDPYYPITPYQVAFGDSCYINITSLLPGGAEVLLDAFNYYELGDSGCVTLCNRHLDNTSAEESEDNPYVVDELAEACINCISCGLVCKANSQEGDTINPFVQGMENNWQPYQDWVYYTKRKPLANQTSKSRDDGNYQGFNQFWKYNATPKLIENNASADNNWTKTNKVTLINGKGSDIENQDALKKYSAALYTFNKTLPKAIADNAPLKDIANDNFEDYNYNSYFNVTCSYEHWNFQENLNPPRVDISNEQAHTGNNSIKLQSGKTITVTRPIINYTDGPILREAGNAVTIQYGCMNYFSPDTGKYIISAWVKEDTCCNPLSYINNQILISYSSSALNYTFYPEGKIIEGWQRYYAEFYVPLTAAPNEISVMLKANSSICYFDDIRIHPVNSNMKTNVYDNKSLRLMAQLDENNYATFYEYDDQGILIRQKKETEAGIITMHESRNSYVKK